MYEKINDNFLVLADKLGDFASIKEEVMELMMEIPTSLNPYGFNSDAVKKILSNWKRFPQYAPRIHTDDNTVDIHNKDYGENTKHFFYK